jgi:tetratricopeptide (TPR) repeat protein
MKAPEDNGSDSLSVSSPASTDAQNTLVAPTRPTVLTFGEYEVISELGEGGMGRVYKAVDRNLGRFVAVKVLRSVDPFECSRFRGEAELIALLDHPNIVKIFAIETTPDGRPYLVLEYAEGGSLDRELAGHPIEPRRAAETVEALARAVQYAHEKGVIHRDLKPANVLRGKDKVLKLTDFGLAKELEVSSGMTPTGAVMGTPSYMAPEQAEGKTKQLGPATDVYGLGAILYELLTGRPPFRGVNMVDTLEQVRWADPAPPSRLVPRLHRDLTTICLKCLQKTPGRRYATAGELADDLRRWLNGETIAARRAASWERLIRQVRRRPWQAAATATTALLLGVLIVTGLYVREKNAEQALAAEREVATRRVQDEQAAAQERVHEAERQASEKLIAAQRNTEDRLRKQADRSLQALNKIRGLVLDGGELSRVAGLQPLYTALVGYYQELIDQEDGGFDTLVLADGLTQIGDLFRRTGDKTRALEAYAKAEAQVHRAGAALPARRALAEVRLKTGRVLLERGDEVAAARACDGAEKLWLRIRTEAGNHDADDRNLAEVYHLRGEILSTRRDFSGAQKAYEEAIRLRRGLVERLQIRSDQTRSDQTQSDALSAEIAARSPADRKKAIDALRDLGRGYGYLGDVFRENDRPTEADLMYWRSHRIRERVVAILKLAPADTPTARGDEFDARQQLARSWGNFADLHGFTRSLGTAEYFARKSLKEADDLVNDAPNVVEYAKDVAERLTQIGELDLLTGRNATRTAAELQRVFKAMPKDDPAGPDGYSFSARGTLATANVLRAHLLAGDRRGAAVEEPVRAELRTGLATLEDLCSERPGVSVRPGHLFYKAAALSLQADLDGAPHADPRWEQALAALHAAVVNKNYRGRNADDLEKFRGLKALIDKNPDPRAKAILDKLHD